MVGSRSSSAISSGHRRRTRGCPCARKRWGSAGSGPCALASTCLRSRVKRSWTSQPRRTSSAPSASTAVFTPLTAQSLQGTTMRVISETRERDRTVHRRRRQDVAEGCKPRAELERGWSCEGALADGGGDLGEELVELVADPFDGVVVADCLLGVSAERVEPFGVVVEVEDGVCPGVVVAAGLDESVVAVLDELGDAALHLGDDRDAACAHCLDE